jgi:hypothetical protein
MKCVDIYGYWPGNSSVPAGKIRHDIDTSTLVTLSSRVTKEYVEKTIGTAPEIVVPEFEGVNSAELSKKIDAAWDPRWTIGILPRITGMKENNGTLHLNSNLSDFATLNGMRAVLPKLGEQTADRIADRIMINSIGEIIETPTDILYGIRGREVVSGKIMSIGCGNDRLDRTPKERTILGALDEQSSHEAGLPLYEKDTTFEEFRSGKAKLCDYIDGIYAIGMVGGRIESWDSMLTFVTSTSLSTEECRKRYEGTGKVYEAFIPIPRDKDIIIEEILRYGSIGKMVDEGIAQTELYVGHRYGDNAMADFMDDVKKTLKIKTRIRAIL